MEKKLNKMSGFIFCVGFFLSLSSNLIAGDSEEFTAQKICKAAIAQIMGRDPKIINSRTTQTNISLLSYIRPNDGERWIYRCKVIDTRIFWATKTGRWRNDPRDPKLTYSIYDKELLIEEDYGDGSSTKKIFTLKQLSE